ncbi:MAG: hypothetical protein KA801_18830 [Syntrophorhabdaceae bacterium]|nr:hypothetical protein [Syntrophorhabdaceae bacterium]
MFHEGFNDRQQETTPTMHQAIDKYFFLKNADHRMTVVIEPVMKEISKELQSRGHESAIIKECQTLSKSGTLHHRHISLIIFTGDKKPACNLVKYPVIAFVADSEKRIVWVREKKIVAKDNRERNAGEYRIGEITRQLVEKHIHNFLREALRKTGL